MKKLNITVQNNENYQIRRELFDNQTHLVVPVVMMVEGVHSGSHGALLHSSEHLSKFPAAWDGIPITIQHPQRGGQYVSANSSDVLQDERVGLIFNTVFADGKLKAEAWVNENLINAKSEIATRHIEQQLPLDVSVGVFTDEIECQGNFNGKEYTAIAENYRPDHLALLPNAVGACSWADGCGIRVNKKRKEKNEVMNVNDTKVKKEYTKLLIQNMGFRAIGEKLQRLLDSMDSENKYHYLEEVYNTYCIYEVSSQGVRTYFKRSYSLEADIVEFTTEPIPVVKQINFINTNNKIDMGKTKGCPECVEALIANKDSNFTQDDKEWLLTQSQEILDKLIPKEIKPVVNTKAEKVTKEQAVNILKESMKTTDDFINLLPSAMQDQFNSALAVHEQQRAYLIEGILNNTEKIWDKDDLVTMKTAMLERIAKSVDVNKETVIDYSAMNANTTVRTEFNEADFLPPAGVEFETKK